MRACTIHTLTLDAVALPMSGIRAFGHSGMPMGKADVATVF
jgi:transketolase